MPLLLRSGLQHWKLVWLDPIKDEAPDMNHCDFHYSHLLPKKPGILPLEETMTKQCRRCGADFHAFPDPETLRRMFASRSSPLKSRRKPMNG